MTQQSLFLIGDIPGFTPQIGRLVSMMNYVRSTTLEAVAGLGVDELDYLHDPQSNSIGTLLSHIAAAEVVSSAMKSIIEGRFGGGGAVRRRGHEQR